jgi:pyruvate/2-oxoglutarate dehydrogenase complex dihydrolipoamide dehydrogenase (E3) component
MKEMKQYDAVIIGSGEAGKYLAWHLGRSGRSVVVVERSSIGGACPNVACLPSKNVIHSAKVVDLVRRGGLFGADVHFWDVDIDAVRKRKQTMIDGLIAMHYEKFDASGAEILFGDAAFVGERTLQVALPNGNVVYVKGDNVFLNTGSRADIPPIPGLFESQPMTHVQALELESLPEHLIIIGGGFVGLELAQTFQRLGSAVTVHQHGPRQLAGEDPEVSEAVLSLMEDEGIDVRLACSIRSIEGRSGDQVRAVIDHCDGEAVLEATHILVATGRKPNTEAMNLSAAGIEITEEGFFRVDDTLRCTAEGVWAMGDCAGSPMFTHVSYDDFRVVRDNLEGRPRCTADRLIPFTLFTDPEVARVGMNETEARAQGLSYRVAKLPMAAVLRTRTLSETRGFLKALVGEDDMVLGFTAFGVGAGELAAAVQVLMLSKRPYTVIAEAILAHPTLAEGLMYLFASVPANSKSPGQ